MNFGVEKLCFDIKSLFAHFIFLPIQFLKLLQMSTYMNKFYFNFD